MNLITTISAFFVAFVMSMFFCFGGIVNMLMTIIVVTLFVSQCYIRYKTEKSNAKV